MEVTLEQPCESPAEIVARAFFSGRRSWSSSTSRWKRPSSRGGGRPCEGGVQAEGDLREAGRDQRGGDRRVAVFGSLQVCTLTAISRVPLSVALFGAPQAMRGFADAPLGDTRIACGAPLEAGREETLLDLEAQSGDCPQMLADVAVGYGFLGDARALAATADADGALAAEGDAEECRQCPGRRAPWPVLPLAHETASRPGRAARGAWATAPGPKRPRSGAGAGQGVALHRATARQLRSAFGQERELAARAALVPELAGNFAGRAALAGHGRWAAGAR
ncbi:unnamed protein product [Prorocentrum cordatum]|uniref:Uncharacterized protein n=1 Tax=Prorocentrum cordatum TaxID=2364126 RepID=A0ABN9PU38_9DINO|nr:unnamed protein product [Polarella glacialis]